MIRITTVVVDVPGYGYADAPEKQRDQWRKSEEIRNQKGENKGGKGGEEFLGMLNQIKIKNQDCIRTGNTMIFKTEFLLIF